VDFIYGGAAVMASDCATSNRLQVQFLVVMLLHKNHRQVVHSDMLDETQARTKCHSRNICNLINLLQQVLCQREISGRGISTCREEFSFWWEIQG